MFEDFRFDWTLAALAGAVFASYAVQTAVGFGAMLMMMALAAQFLPIELVQTYGVPLSQLQTIFLVIRYRGAVRWRYLLRQVVPLMAIGVALGLALSAAATAVGAGVWLRRGFGVLVLVLAAREVIALVRAKKKEEQEEEPGTVSPLPRLAQVGTVVSAGIVHGMYVTGGPLLVYVLGREPMTKQEFRATISAIWVLLNSFLLGTFIYRGNYEPRVVVSLAVLLPFLALGVLTGEWLHGRVSERRFKIGVFSLLIVAGISLAVR